MPIDELLNIIRSQPGLELAWGRVLNLFATHQSSALWSALPQPDFTSDKMKVRHWLQGNLQNLAESSGIYLGLDTLNMDEGAGTNIEIGWLPCDMTRNDTSWIYEGLQRGESMLIPGLHALHAMYSSPEWKAVFSLADYLVFLGYSGLVLREAFNELSAPQDLLVAWGFHDGDMFILGRMHAGNFELICQCGG